MSKVKVSIQAVEQSGVWEFNKIFPVDIYEVAEQLDEYQGPDDVAGRMVRYMICTPPNRIAKIRGDREKIAKMVGEIVKEHVLNWLNSTDTINGYPVEK